MKALVIGSGGREHAISYSLHKSGAKVYALGGNPGFKDCAQLVKNINPANFQEIASFAKDLKIDLVVVGPELPLTQGLADILEKNNLNVFAPNKEAAQLESSKSFAKDIMETAGIKTANYKIFTNKKEALLYLEQINYPQVLKADGLAAGKGVVVCFNLQEAKDALNYLFGQLKTRKIIIEQFIQGKEASFIVAVGGNKVYALPTSHDYKRVFDGNKGPNTGGMGSISPTPYLSTSLKNAIKEKIIIPLLKTLKTKGINYKGFLYGGLIIDQNNTPWVLEFNVRLGDPETQSILRRINCDFADLLYSLSQEKNLQNRDFIWQEVEQSDNCAVCIVLASSGYPKEYKKGFLISGIDQAEKIEGVKVFCAGVDEDKDGNLITTGGRVLNVTATAKTMEYALKNAYQACNLIEFEGKHFRRDIGSQNWVSL